MSDLSRLALILTVLVPLARLADEPAPDSAGQSSRLAVDKNARTHSTTISVSRELPIEIQTTIKGHSCDPTMALRYEQRDTVARVEATIENPSCAACSGEYTIAVRVRDDSGESKTLEFEGQWQRADDRPVQFTKDYAVGTNVDVLNVRAKSVHCVCAAAEPAASADTAPKE
jgi:hypothetical protein